MGRLIKWLVYILILALVLLILYAYAGPYLGVDFSAQSSTQIQPVTLQTDK